MVEAGMKTPELVKTTNNEIENRIKQLAESYTPEWRFDKKHPDGGTALALLYADLYEDTLKKYNQIPRKNMLEFFNQTGAKLKSASPSSGYASFSLVSDQSGIEIPRGTKLLGQGTDLNQSTIVFETQNDIYVTPAQISEIYEVLPHQDGIYQVYDSEKEGDEFKPFRLFQATQDNLQEHRMEFTHPYLFYLKEQGRIGLNFWPARKTEDLELFFDRILNGQNAVWSYQTEEGFEPFRKMDVIDGVLWLYQETGQPTAFKKEFEGEESYVIRCETKNAEAFAGFLFQKITLYAEGRYRYPTFVFAGGVEQEKREFYPFGEQMGVFEEVYFASDEVFSKKGAQVTMEFLLSFVKIPTDTFGKKEINWKLVMKQEDFIPDPEYDIQIDEVIWEYFNGNGWNKLSESGQYAEIFNTRDGLLEKKIVMNFQCPMDIAPILVNSVTTYYIRARILKMNHSYKLNGKYVPPIIRDIRLSFAYRQITPIPETVILKNNQEKIRYRSGDMKNPKLCFSLFTCLKEKRDTLYIGFRQPITAGPVKFYFKFQGTYEKIQDQILFEYFGNGKFKTVNAVDETEGFNRCGIITFLSMMDFEKSTLWGLERYWLRISRMGVSSEGRVTHPIIENIHMNTTPILAVDTKIPEWFYMEPNQKNAQIYLSSQNIYELHVWVKEYYDLTEEEQKRLMNEYMVRIHELDDGARREVYVQWKEVDNFSMSDSNDRHYCVDRNLGIVSFGDGIHGKLPDSDISDTICVEYQCSSGKAGNLPVGAINRLNSSIAYINKVINYEPTYGGCDQETVDIAVERSAKEFRHHGRAVTLDDYVAIMKESLGNILMVKCYSGCDQNGNIASGHVTAAVLLEDYQMSGGHFQDVEGHILDYMRGKLPDRMIKEGRFHIVEPKLISMAVHVKIFVEDMDQVFFVRYGVLNRLKQFFHPLTGNFNGQGFSIGQVPNQIQIQNVIRSVEGVIGMGEIHIAAFCEANGESQEIDYDRLTQMKFIIPVNGEHEIEFVIGGEA